VWPCGACLQVLAEFADSNCPVIMAEGTKTVTLASLAELLPHAFSKRDLQQRTFG